MQVTGQIHFPAVVSPQSEHWYLLARRLGKNYSWSGHYLGEKYFLLLPGIESRLLYCPVQSQLNIHSGDLKFMQEVLWVPLRCADDVACLLVHNLNFISRNSRLNNSFEYAC